MNCSKMSIHGPRYYRRWDITICTLKLILVPFQLYYYWAFTYGRWQRLLWSYFHFIHFHLLCFYRCCGQLLWRGVIIPFSDLSNCGNSPSLASAQAVSNAAYPSATILWPADTVLTAEIYSTK